MKNMYKIAALVSVMMLSGCADLKTQFKPVDEPVAGTRARLRVVANMLVKAVPDKACIDWNAPGAGTVYGGIVGSSGYRGRSLGMPQAKEKHDSAGELYVAANQPFTLVLMSTPEGVYYGGRKYSCSVAGSFVPKGDRDYEASLFIEPSAGMCSIRVVDLGDRSVSVPVSEAKFCKN